VFDIKSLLFFFFDLLGFVVDPPFFFTSFLR
jgi:hypothetical protein